MYTIQITSVHLKCQCDTKCKNGNPGEDGQSRQVVRHHEDASPVMVLGAAPIEAGQLCEIEPAFRYGHIPFENKVSTFVFGFVFVSLYLYLF